MRWESRCAQTKNVRSPQYAWAMAERAGAGRVGAYSASVSPLGLSALRARLSRLLIVGRLVGRSVERVVKLLCNSKMRQTRDGSAEVGEKRTMEEAATASVEYEGGRGVEMMKGHRKGEFILRTQCLSQRRMKRSALILLSLATHHSLLIQSSASAWRIA